MSIQLANNTLILSLFIQIIEATMYVWLSLSVINSSSMVQRRYIDWFITTPIMLLTTIIYMRYNTIDKTTSLTLSKIIMDEQSNLSTIFSYNALMLFSGLIAEFYPRYSKILVLIGFYFFYKLFYTIYDRFVLNNIINTRLFIFITVIWGLYGVAALMTVHVKNICYNILDIISKNFYEIYIFWIMLNLN